MRISSYMAAALPEPALAAEPPHHALLRKLLDIM